MSASSTHSCGPAPLHYEDYVHRRSKANSYPLSLAVCGNPFPKMIRGRRTSVLYKEGRPPLRRDLIFISGLLARLSWFFNLWPVRAL
jgi:hypothetical protein